MKYVDFDDTSENKSEIVAMYIWIYLSYLVCDGVEVNAYFIVECVKWYTLMSSPHT